MQEDSHPAAAAGGRSPDVHSQGAEVRSRAARTGPLHSAAGGAHAVLPVVRNSPG